MNLNKALLVLLIHYADKYGKKLNKESIQYLMYMLKYNAGVEVISYKFNDTSVGPFSIDIYDDLCNLHDLNLIRFTGSEIKNLVEAMYLINKYDRYMSRYDAVFFTYVEELLSLSENDLFLLMEMHYIYRQVKAMEIEFPDNLVKMYDICNFSSKNPWDRKTFEIIYNILSRLPKYEAVCTCDNPELNNLSQLFSEIFEEPIKFVDVYCPIHGGECNDTRTEE